MCTTTYKKLKNSGSISLLEVKKKVSEHSRNLRLTNKSKNLTHDLMKIKMRIINLMKDIGFPKMKKLSIEYEQEGMISFWYRENNVVYFEKTEQPASAT